MAVTDSSCVFCQIVEVGQIKFGVRHLKEELREEVGRGGAAPFRV
jgi:hypothetical protein